MPFASTWWPGAVAWGVVAFYLLIAVELTSLARRLPSKRLWRAVHMASFPLYLLGTVHALAAGTDTASLVFRAVAAATTTVIVALTIARIRQSSRPAPVRVPARLAAERRAADAQRELVSVR